MVPEAEAALRPVTCQSCPGCENLHLALARSACTDTASDHPVMCSPAEGHLDVCIDPVTAGPNGMLQSSIGPKELEVGSG